MFCSTVRLDLLPFGLIHHLWQEPREKTVISGERSRVIQTRMTKAGNTGRQTREKRELSQRMRRKGKGRQNTSIWRVPCKGRTQTPPFMCIILFNLKGKTKGQYCYYICSTKHSSFWDTLLINSSQILWKHRKTLCSLNSSELLAQDWGFNGIMFVFLCLFMFVFLNA